MPVLLMLQQLPEANFDSCMSKHFSTFVSKNRLQLNKKVDYLKKRKIYFFE